MKLPIAMCAALGLAVVGCSTSETSQPAAGAAGDAAAPTFGSSACGACVQSSCQAELSACSAEPSCAAHWECVRGCGVTSVGQVDPACEAACPAAAAGTAQQLDEAFNSCRATKAACPACGPVPEAGADAPAEAGPQQWILHQQCGSSSETQPCAVCEDEHCCQTYLDCLNDPACQQYKLCLKSCDADGGTSCWAACAEQQPAGVPHWAARQACFSVFCGAECSGALTSCDACINAKCAAAWVEYVADPKGFLLWACLDACAGDQPCESTCKLNDPAATELLDAFTACSLTHCAAEC